MKVKLIGAAVLATAFASAASADVLWDNGGIVTHAGQGFGGADVSMASSDVNSGGFNAGTFGDGTYWRRADNFTVGAGGWSVDSVSFLIYSTGNTPPNTPWAGFDMNIWSGMPGAGSIVANSTTVLGTPTFTNIYRVFNGAGNLMNTDRAVFEVTLDFSGINLAAGEYYIDFQVNQGAGSAWIPPVMNGDGSTFDGDQLQFGADNIWTEYVAGNGQGTDIPFIVNGSLIPAPGALALLGLAGLAGVRRRRA